MHNVWTFGQCQCQNGCYGDFHVSGYGSHGGYEGHGGHSVMMLGARCTVRSQHLVVMMVVPVP